MSYKNKPIPNITFDITTEDVFLKESKGSLNFRLKKQRKRGLWSDQQKSELFTSMIQNDITTMMSMRDTEGWSDDYNPITDRDKLIAELKDKDRELEMLDGNQKSGIIAEIYADKIKCKPGTAYVDIDGTGNKVEIKFDACTWSELKQQKYGVFLRKNFDNHKWVFSVYHKDMTNEEKGLVMRIIDNGVKMIDEELRNTFDSYGISAISDFLWQTDSDNVYTEKALLFDKCKFTENDMSRYKVNDFIVKCLHKLLNKLQYNEYCFTITNTANLDKMVATDHYFNSKKIVDELLVEAEQKFTLIYNILKATNIFDGGEKQTIKNPSKLNLYFDIVCGLEFKYGKYKDDWKIEFPFFGPALLEAIDNLSNRKLHSSDPDQPTPFEDLLGKHTPWEIRKKVALVLNELEKMGYDKTGFVQLCPQRTADKVTLRKVWQKQNGICPIRKVEIPFEKVVAAHKDKPYSKGGDVSEANTIAISSEFNNYQGVLDWNTFYNEMQNRGIAV